MEPIYYTVNQVAGIMKRHRTVVQRLIDRGVMDTYRPTNRVVLIAKEEVERVMQIERKGGRPRKGGPSSIANANN